MDVSLSINNNNIIITHKTHTPIFLMQHKNNHPSVSPKSCHIFVGSNKIVQKKSLNLKLAGGVKSMCMKKNDHQLHQFEDGNLMNENKPESDGNEEEMWKEIDQRGKKCRGEGEVEELLECLEKEAIMGDDEGKTPIDYNRRAFIFHKSNSVFQALKDKQTASSSH